MPETTLQEDIQQIVINEIDILMKNLKAEAAATEARLKDEKNAKRPLAYRIYKGMGGKMGCFQFNLVPAYKGNKKDEGAVFIDAAPAIDKNKYELKKLTDSGVEVVTS